MRLQDALHRGVFIRTVSACGLVLALGSGRAADKNFWSAKPYSEWTEKEVDKMMKSSPWSKTITLSFGMGGGDPGGGGGFGRAGIPGGGAGGGGGDPEIGGGGGGGGAGGFGGGGGGGGGMRGGGGGGMGGGMTSALPSIVITWYTQPVRQAMARRVQLRTGEATPEQLDRILKYRNPASLEFLVFGGSPRMLGNASPEAIQKMKDETFLLKKNKEKVALGEAALPSGPGQPLLLRFPRESGGKPVVTVEDKEIELVTRFGGSTIRTKFKLADMVVDGRLEI